jgi:hypothetical protein
MRCPNRRYGNPLALQQYVDRMGVKGLAKHLMRSERSIQNWITGKKKMPYWVPELLRLQDMEHREIMRQMNIPVIRAQLGIVTASASIRPFRNPTRQRSTSTSDSPHIENCKKSGS